MASKQPSTSSVAREVIRNVTMLAQVHAEAEGRVGRHQRLVERITASIASPWTVLVLLAAITAWIALNAIAAHAGLPPFDPPPFFWMQGAATIAALFVTLLVLATQRRQAMRAARRGDLELQVNLLAEQKTAKLVALIEELRRDLPSVRDRVDPVANAMTEAVDPGAVLSVIGAPPAKDPR